MEPTRPTHKGGVTVLRQLEAARAVALPILLSKFAKQYSNPLPEQLNLGIGAPKPETELSPLAILHRKRKWGRHCTGNL